jgi:ABC-type transport system involved in cytochrome c biogenesis permease subunit
MTFGFLSIALLGYIIGIILVVISTVYRSSKARHAASVAFALTWMAHLGAVIEVGVAAGRIPLGNLPEYLLVLGWAVLSLHLYVWFRLRIHMAGLLLPPMAAIAALVSLSLLSGEVARSAARQSALFFFHTAVSTLGMAILCVAFAMSMLYILQDRALKTKMTLGFLQRLPSLEKCDTIGFRALLTGFMLLTLGIGTGVVVNVEVHRRLWVWQAKGSFALLAWIVFAATLTARTALGFRGRRSAYLIIAGFVLAVLTAVGMTL